MVMQYLSIDEVIALHKYSVERFGGSSDLLNRGKLEASLAAPMQNVFDTELYPDVWSKAAILGFSLIKNHAFIDGNKRIGLFAMLRFLEINGYSLSGVTNDELYQFTIDIASSAIDKDEITAWLKAHTIPSAIHE